MELFSPGHLVVILVVALILFFGWKQLPDMSRSLGRSLRIFRTEIKGMSSDDEARRDAGQAPPPAPYGTPQVTAPGATSGPVPPSSVPPAPMPAPSGPPVPPPAHSTEPQTVPSDQPPTPS